MNELGTDYRKKGRRNFVVRAISDVKLSELARAINPDLATVNLFLNKSETTDNEIPLACEDLKINPDANIETRSLMYEDIHGGTDYEMRYRHYYRGFYFQNLNLRHFYELLPTEAQTDKFRTEFLNQYLLAHHLGTVDMITDNNIIILRNPDGEYETTKAFDLEFGVHTVDEWTAKNMCINQYITDGAYGALELGIDPENVQYIRGDKVLRKTANEFIERAHTVRNTKLDEIFNYEKIVPVVRHYLSNADCQPALEKTNIARFNARKVLQKMGEVATKGYRDRFEMLADQYAEPATKGGFEL